MEGLNTHSSSGPRGYFEKSGRSVHEYYFRICAMPTTFRNNFALLIDSKSMDGAILRRLGNFSFTNCLCLMMWKDMLFIICHVSGFLENRYLWYWSHFAIHLCACMFQIATPEIREQPWDELYGNEFDRLSTSSRMSVGFVIFSFKRPRKHEFVASCSRDAQFSLFGSVIDQVRVISRHCSVVFTEYSLHVSDTREESHRIQGSRQLGIMLRWSRWIMTPRSSLSRRSWRSFSRTTITLPIQLRAINHPSSSRTSDRNTNPNTSSNLHL